MSSNLSNSLVRFSASPIWHLQRAFFNLQGVAAWRKNIVPNYVTSNSFIANAYVTLALAFIKDYLNSDHFIDNEPIYIIELGTGSGRFSYSFLQIFFADQEILKDVDVIYVMSDLAEANLNYWREHESFQPFVKAGRLDFAIFDASDHQPLKLSVSKKILSLDSVHAPLIAIANYFFDSIPYDLFAINNGQLYECLSELVKNDGTTAIKADDNVTDFDVKYELRSCDSNYYENSLWNSILTEYTQNLLKSFFAFPSAALSTIEYLRQLTSTSFMLISGDKGYSQLLELASRNAAQPAKHGSISFAVNYHAIGEYTRLQAGQFLDTDHSHSSIKVICSLFGKEEFKYTNEAYQQNIVTFGPDDFFMIKKLAEKNYNTLSVGQILSLLRLSRWDRIIFLGCYDRLVEILAESSPQEKNSFLAAAKAIWQQYLPLQESEDLAFCLGCLLAGAGFYQEAISFFEISIKYYGEDEITGKNLAQCRSMIDRSEK